MASKDSDKDSASSDLVETRLDGETAYTGSFFSVTRDRVRLPDGGVSHREFITHPGAVAILAFTAAGELVMERQYRYPVGRDMLEIPAGKIDPGEAPLQTARRELEEETGYRAASWRHLGVMHPCIGYSNERIEYFLAEGLTQTAPKLDDGEFLEVFTITMEVAMDWVRLGRITDTKTIAGLLWAEKVRAGIWS